MLSTKGLTSTEASAVANFVKEKVKSFDVSADNFKIISSTTTRNGGKVLLLDNNVRIPNWVEQLREKAKYFSLSTWLKEAIQFKDNAIKAVREEKFVSTTILESTPEAPITPKTSLEDYLATLTVKELAEYWTQHAVASHIGKFVHNYDNIRTQLKMYEPTTFRPIGNGEALTVENTLLYTPGELNESLDSLQAEHRASNKLINYHLAKHKEWENALKTKYQADYQKWSQDYRDVSLRNNAVTRDETAKFEKERIAKLEELSKMKIIIPEALQPILDEVYKTFKVD